MEIGPIFRALYHSKSRFTLIVIEIGLTLAIVANCMNMILDVRAKMQRPSGMDVPHLLIATSEPFAPEFEEEEYQKASFEEDLRSIRALPGVRAAASMHQIPLSGAGSSTGRRPSGSEIDTLSTPLFVVSNGIVEALGVELIAGRDFTEADFAEGPEEESGEDEGAMHNVILTKEMADLLYPDGDALGKTIEGRSRHFVDTIVGIVGLMQNSWPMSSIGERVMLYPGRPYSSRRVRYVVRAEPGMVDSLYTGLEEELLRLNEGRIVTVRTLAEIRDDQFQDENALNTMLGVIALLLVAVTSLGIVGLTAFSVTQRTKQVGTRRALGATRWAILRYFLVENWVITSVGLGVGLLVTYGLNYVLTQVANVPIIRMPLLGSGMVLLWVVGLMAALAPAIRGTMVPPVIATRTV